LRDQTDQSLDFFFADNATTPVSSVEIAYAAESILLQYMFRKDFPSAAPFTKSLSEWPYYAANGTIANITLSGFEFEPVPDINAQRCAYINSLAQDPNNGV
jgi:hypothetical protein